jgi:hypothetical protein
VVRSENQGRSFTANELPNGLDFFRGGLLLGDHMIQPEGHQRVGVVEHTVIQRQLLSRWSMC